MIIKIDQSGKVEETAKDTVVAFTHDDDLQRSIMLSKREKRKIQKFFREIGKPKFYMYKVFIVLVFLLIKDYLPKLDRIIIDPEYPGQEELLRNLLFELIHTVDPKFERRQIVFERVGKRSPAHIAANETFRRERKPSLTVNAKTIFQVVAK